jgi:hypothetical protein
MTIATREHFDALRGGWSSSAENALRSGWSSSAENAMNEP